MGDKTLTGFRSLCRHRQRWRSASNEWAQNKKRTKGKICKSKIPGSLFDAVGCWENNVEQKFVCSGVMSEPRTRVAAGSPQFCELWRNVSKLYNKTRDKTPGTAMSPVCNGEIEDRFRSDDNINLSVFILGVIKCLFVQKPLQIFISCWNWNV